MDAYLRTNQPHIYAVGDVNGLSLLAHAASAQGELAGANAVSQTSRAYDGNLVPRCLYTWPEVASVGLQKLPSGPLFDRVTSTLSSLSLNTVCVEAKYPNRLDCWQRGTLTFQILGAVCTRACGFCAETRGNPKGVIDIQEPEKVAQAAKTLGLRHVVMYLAVL